MKEHTGRTGVRQAYLQIDLKWNLDFWVKKEISICELPPCQKNRQKRLKQKTTNLR